MGTPFEADAAKLVLKLGEIIKDEIVMTLGVKRGIEKLKSHLDHFRAVREEFEVRAMQDPVIEVWWKDMTRVMFGIEDVLEHFEVHSQKTLLAPRSVYCNLSFLSCLAKLSFDHKTAKRIKDINKKLDEIKSNGEMFRLERISSQQSQRTSVDRSQTSSLEGLYVVGRDIKQAADDMVQMIVSNCHEKGATVFGIEGMGGIGKTTLAQKICNEQRIRETFQIHIWLCVTRSYNENDLLKQAIRTAKGTCDQLEAKAELLLRLMHTIEGKSVFLVLDDVWRPDIWSDLLQSPFGKCFNACILVTSREWDVLTAMHATYIHRVNRMNDKDGLDFLMKKSLGPDKCGSGFSNVGCEIVKKCDGLPLAIKVVAGVLSTKRTRAEWETIRDSPWSTEGLPQDIGGPLFLSYMSLSPQLKQCFCWCALLPPNYGIHRDDVANWWVAESFVTEEYGRSIDKIKVAEEYYHDLIRRNLLQPKPEFVDKGISTMHDLLRSLGQTLTKHHSLYMDAGNSNALSKGLHRLVISSAIEEMPALEEQKCMRSLLVFDNEELPVT